MPSLKHQLLQEIFGTRPKLLLTLLPRGEASRSVPSQAILKAAPRDAVDVNLPDRNADLVTLAIDPRASMPMAAPSRHRSAEPRSSQPRSSQPRSSQWSSSQPSSTQPPTSQGRSSPSRSSPSRPDQVSTPRPSRVFVVEVQLRQDERKKYSWPIYQACQRARYQCPCDVVVITLKKHVARWARQPIVLGEGVIFQPLVIGPDEIPKVTELAQAIGDPDLALLSVLAHGRSDDAKAIGRAAMAAFGRLPASKAVLYSELSAHALSAKVLLELEDVMEMFKVDLSSFEPKKAKAFWMRVLRHDIEAKVEKEHKKGVKEGVKEGVALATARSVLRVLKARGIKVSPQVRKRILACTDIETLEAWHERSVTVSSADELFE